MHGRTIALEQEILAKNQALAERNRGWFEGREVLALNLMSSPGSGKTSLLERTIRALRDEMRIYVVEGDQATTNDAERIRATGCAVIQVNTGTGCHLEADMLARGMQQLKPPPGSLVLIENVGNLVCPALFDLGERAKVVVVSVTEGEDKPIKYPHMFRACRLMLINKIDLLPHVRFDVDRCIAYAREVNPDIEVLCVSAETGEGIEAWYQWLRHELVGQQELCICGPRRVSGIVGGLRGFGDPRRCMVASSRPMSWPGPGPGWRSMTDRRCSGSRCWPGCLGFATQSMPITSPPSTTWSAS